MDVPDSVDSPPVNQAIGADADVQKMQPGKKKVYLDKSAALSETYIKTDTIATRQIAVLAADGFDMQSFKAMQNALKAEHAMVKIVAPHGGTITCSEGMEHKVDAAILTTESVLFDAVYIPGGQASVDALLKKAKFKKFVDETFMHCKAIAVDGAGVRLLDATHVGEYKHDDKAVFVDGTPRDFIDAVAQHRNYARMEVAKLVPA